MYQRILLAADGSKNSIRAAQEAAKIASLAPDSCVEILFVADMDKVKNEVLHSQGHEEIELKRQQKLIPIAEQLSAKNVNHKTKIIIGDPGPAIVEYANNEKVDLVVIGSRGLNAFQEFVLGSVSHKVVKRVQCPVMVVK
ncbi:universal stress protein [Brevibacillus brevis]|uniref:universal stress protein n=1 Tax=Brevibacillus brevis TaxID=1393 RepID=UPI000D105097|nr:universal stress protein [Brevibacillus brevis]PSJ68221.1 universal stress protein [Brevibacillus brevis]RED35727.1 nucleotide-binding universal stress UspA family protein [Brevibacillus brevis]GEC89270.1 universal stress protein [Brevibacillus brevis]VEF89162.1 Universal stress protein Rv1636/MT1672 [Brevibacillus brevis]